MTLIAASGLTKTVGARTLFAGLTFNIDPGSRIGLVGVNGCGKTTLLRLLAGEEEPEGTLTRRRGLRVARLDQSASFPAGATVHEAMLQEAEELRALETRMTEIHEALAAPDCAAAETERLLARLARLEHDFEQQGGHDAERRLVAILDGLGFPQDRHGEAVAGLSGGEQNRVALAQLLFCDPDLWLLDEPTNHLDLDGVEFLERFLEASPAAVIVVSHDRRFLDRVTRETWELENQALETYPGGWTRSRQLRAERRADQLRRYQQQTEVIRREEEYIRRYGAGQRAREAKGRSKRLARLERLEKPADRARIAALHLPAGARLGNRVLEVDNLAMGFAERPLFAGLTFELHPGETLALVGPNGSGKTTLLRLLLGELTPQAGRVNWGETTRTALLSQQERFPEPEATALSFLLTSGIDLGEQEVRDTLGAMLFRGDDVSKPVRVLSGGEQKRLMLTQLLLQGHNVLLLDEPTNHLDAESCEALEQALCAYDGCLVLISHDRALLDNLADRTLWLEGGEWHLTHGGCAEAQEARALRQAAAAEQRDRTKTAPTRAARRPRGNGVGPFGRLKTAQIEERIIAHEERRDAIHTAFGDPATYQDAERMKALQSELEELERELAYLEAEYASREA